MNIEKNKFRYLPYLIIAVLSTVILFKPFGSGDELWNYNFARNIANGMIPYKDFSIVQTPLSAYIAAGFLKIFGKGLFVHRILGGILLFLIIAEIYRLCRRITGSEFLASISALLIYGMHLLCFIYNYNYLSVLILLYIIDIELHNDSDSMRKNLLIGLLIGTLPIIKQNTGGILLLGNFVICLVNILVFKKHKMGQFYRAVTSLAASFLFFVYMLIVGGFSEFWEYAVSGIGSFIHRYSPIDLLTETPAFSSLFVFIGVVYIVIAYRIIKEGIESTKLSCLILTTLWISVAYPLCDAYHLMCFIIPLVPIFFLFARRRKHSDTETYISIAIVSFVCSVSFFCFWPSGVDYMFSNIRNYENIVISKSMNQYIKQVDQFIEERVKEGDTVRIVDDSAAAYKIPLNQYEKNWDMLLVGNLGSNTVSDLLKVDGKCVYLVYQDTDSLSMQNHFELINYIKQNYKKVGEVLYFDVYEK